MTWLTWRQFRVPAASVLGAVVLICVVLAITRPELVNSTNVTDQKAFYYGSLFAVYLLPAVIGVFWGVPMVTREVETGTHSLVWNQTVTRKSWLANKMGFGAVAAMIAAGLLSAAVNWWASPIDTLAGLDPASQFEARLAPVVFAARGIAPIGYAAFAFVLGVAIGMLLRRTVAAMAVTLVVFAAVQVAFPLLVRPYLLPATEQTVTITADSIAGIRAEPGPTGDMPESLSMTRPAGAWVLTDETVDAKGDTVFPLPAAVHGCLPSPRGGGPSDLGPVQECFARTLTDLGHRQHQVYQPAGRFWPLQWVETAVFLALSALLAWFCFRRIRHLS
ncbi:ABC-2 family transporter [Herbihabitans rhizosphaerae]|uniref:ABC-2 family transporter n=1 Tax=Herbihabitans rhizosphaerae TaxID=1872711 RepID=A0A4Q7L3Z8_9PSEU|nr:ABC transporter permease subunit [Herbihabitans rhizosphaerae]RZS44348.1 ABC-2 family transporter [Herbihabitans rhizosphaerae]